jgi:hypothetical protein
MNVPSNDLLGTTKTLRNADPTHWLMVSSDHSRTSMVRANVNSLTNASAFGRHGALCFYEQLLCMPPMVLDLWRSERPATSSAASPEAQMAAIVQIHRFLERPHPNHFNSGSMSSSTARPPLHPRSDAPSLRGTSSTDAAVSPPQTQHATISTSHRRSATAA